MISIFNTSELKKIKIAEAVKAKHFELENNLIAKIKNNKKIRVLFLVVHESIWKFDTLFERLRDSELFEPQILVCPYTIDTKEVMLDNLDKSYKFFKSKSYPVYNALDNGKWLSVDTLSPDIVFFTYPHSLTLDKYYSDVFLNYLSCYSGYGLKTVSYGEGQDQYNQLFHNCMWKTFISSPEDFDITNRVAVVKEKSVELSGCCNSELLFLRNSEHLSQTQPQEREKKLIIWAPHHTITESWLPLATFLKNHSFFQELALKTKDTVDWVFKPHPALRAKMYKHSDWGEQRTNEYFSFWEQQENTSIQEGDYIDLFVQSDALILDSATFVGEYHFVDKPMLYLMNDNALNSFTPLGRDCLDACTIAYENRDIENFVQAVLENKDDNKKARAEFLAKHSYVLGVNNKLPSEIIKDSILRSLECLDADEHLNVDDAKVSICLVTNNHQDSILYSLNSILAQDYTNIEVVIVDRGSTDATKDIIDEFKGMHHEQIKINADYLSDVSYLEAANHAVLSTDSDYVAVLSAGDAMSPGRVSEQVAFLRENQDCNAVFTNIDLAEEQKSDLNLGFVKQFNQPVFNASRLLLAKDVLYLSTALIRRGALIDADCSSMNIQQRYNYALVSKLALQGKLNKIEKSLTQIGSSSLHELMSINDRHNIISSKELVAGVCDYITTRELSDLTGLEDLSDLEEVEVLLGLSSLLQLLDNYYLREPGPGFELSKYLVSKAQKLGVFLTQNQLDMNSSLINGSKSVHRLLNDECVKWFGDLLPAIDIFSDNKILEISREASIEDWLDARQPDMCQKSLIQAALSKQNVSFSCTVFITNFANNKEALLQSQKNIKELQVEHAWLRLNSECPVDPKSFIIQLNNWLSSSTDQWFLVLAAGDELTPNGLLMARIKLAQQLTFAAISFDEVYRNKDGSLGAALRPSVNLDYLLSFPAGMSKHWLFNRQALLDIGCYNSALPDAFELDAILRLINQGGLECLGHISEPLVITALPVLANVEDERLAIESHLRHRGYANAQLHAPNPGRYQVQYKHPAQPVISVVIAAGNDLARLQRCTEGLLGGTSYQNFEIVFIDQPQSSAAVKKWLAELSAMGEAKLRVFATNHIELSEQYNEVQQHAIGDYLLFLSADIAIVTEHWLDAMLNHAQRGEVGIVGAKLLSVDGYIAHAGHILGLEGPVGSPFVGELIDAPGYMQRLQVDHNLSAVGGDCIMVLKDLFVELDGFSHELADDYLSTDFCLRAREAGFLTVWTPHAQLMIDKDEYGHRPDSAQQDAMYEKWLPQLARDPAYNPNFSLALPGGFKLADSQISSRPLADCSSVPVALVHPADLYGCGHYRVMQPFLAMKEAGLLDGAISTGLMHVTDLERYNPDTIVLQRQIGDERLEAMQRMQRFSRAIKVYELDDYLPNLPLKSVHRKHMPKDILKSLRQGLGFVDRFVVSTHALAEAFSGLHGEIVVRQNRLPLSWWQGLQTQRRQGKKPRVGWAGGSSHTGDLELIVDVVRDLADEVEWVFFGMCPDALKPYVHEFHGGVPIEQYPAKLASLNLDLGLAPLEHNLFNECKSNLRQLEYGVCGVPVICTDIRPYQDGLQAGLPVTLVKNRYKDWVGAIRMHINDLDATARMGDELQAKVLAEWMLEGEHLKRWSDAWLRG